VDLEFADELRHGLNAFGDQAPVGFGLNLRFPGQFADSESGLSYNYFRDYEAGTGRYVESDPIGLKGGISTFGYVDSNPIDDFDPEGLSGRRGGGERGQTGGVSGKGTNNPYKHCREFNPPQRDFVRCSPNQTGKWVRKPMPPEMPFPMPRDLCEPDKPCENIVIAPSGFFWARVAAVCTLMIFGNN